MPPSSGVVRTSAVGPAKSEKRICRLLLLGQNLCDGFVNHVEAVFHLFTCDGEWGSYLDAARTHRAEEEQALLDAASDNAKCEVVVRRFSLAGFDRCRPRPDLENGRNGAR